VQSEFPSQSFIWSVLAPRFQAELTLRKSKIWRSWRKQRIRDKRRFDIQAALERVENNVLWQDPPPLLETALDLTKYQFINRSSESQPHPRTDYQQLLGFSSSLYRDRKISSLSMVIDLLPMEFGVHLKEKVPHENYETTAQWIVALKKEVDGVLLPMVRKRQPESDRYFETAAKFLTNERILADLESVRDHAVF
jgi:hypothetical protein